MGLILGGLVATAVFLYSALQLKKRDKWWPVMGALMFLAGLGLVGIAAWVAQLAAGAGMVATLIVGSIALILGSGFGIATAADLSDKKLDKPWNLFALPALLTIVLFTGDTTFGYVADLVETNVQTLTSRVDTR
ncbi:hypothetical protein E1286_05350 [Nonomuraea terrae]|uniref:Uncharacterized protein n=1 Tax=Nonomuraea terrae TaxID=2530383 RepID=A0A4R4Z9F4_9ACTN|nr:hypothetical protein [Nonomuraea terrae]TDD54616.1 hypothetical protein E1286_05350 [Nonomuraea terrae]